MSTHFRKLRIKEIRRETTECVSILFEIPFEWKDEFSFVAGQNLTLRLMMDGEEIRRSYSICSSPFENEWRVAVKKQAGGRFSTFANDKLQAGELLDVLPPTGSFTVHPSPTQTKNYIAFAAGSGITPVISILKAILATEPNSNFTLVYGNRNRSSIVFKEELEALKNKYVDRFALFHTLSAEQTDTPLNEGRINEEKCEQLSHVMNLFSFDGYFLCGPEAMIRTVKNYLQHKNVSESRIHFELFTPPGSAKNLNKPEIATEMPDHRNSTVTLRADGIQYQFPLGYDSLSILDAGLQQGADLPYACKAGVCSTCRAKLLNGKVEMDVNYALEEDELEAGFILTCQSHPTTPGVEVDYDAK